LPHMIDVTNMPYASSLKSAIFERRPVSIAQDRYMQFPLSRPKLD
jgi:hypothetical protein